MTDKETGMNGTAVPNLDDPWVRAMAERNHEPKERWLPINRVDVVCETDGQAWPCATRRALNRIAGMVADGLPEWEAALLLEDGDRPEGDPVD